MNNAGGAATGATEGSELDGDLSNYDYAMDLNTKRFALSHINAFRSSTVMENRSSVLRLCQLAFPHLTKTKGEIVNVSSIAGRDNGAVSCVNYSILQICSDL